MQEQYLFEPIPENRLDELTPEEMKIIIRAERDLNRQFKNYINELEKELFKTLQKSFLLEEQAINIKHRLFGKSSEKSEKKSPGSKDKKDPKKRVLLPSERYPNVDIIEKRVELDQLPTCPCCSKEMKDSGLTEDSEYLTVIPRRFYVVRQKRVKYRCSSCQEGLMTTPAIPRIKAGSSYSDEMVVDVALSKYCDLIPIDRYVQMAARGGVSGIPPNTLIEGTHNLANFLLPVYQKIKQEIAAAKILHADETPHRMLEGSDKSQWYLWGFSTDSASYFEVHDTRSGAVASDIIKASQCEFLISDVFSGYSKAVSDSNAYRRENNLPLVQNAYCNAHARRKFKEAESSFPLESELFIRCYQKIYFLEKLRDFKTRRQWQALYYRAMELQALRIKSSYSTKSSLAKALNYLLNNFNELTLFLKFDLPIDNNAQERLLRSPVVGRKTWYGTHSPKGAETSAVLFSLIESCKLNKVNPREYFKDIVHAIHEKRAVFTPRQYLRIKEENIA